MSLIQRSASYNSLSMNSLISFYDSFSIRMLDEFFAEQMKEVIRLCAKQRQTMLFSATMTEAVSNSLMLSSLIFRCRFL